MAAKASEPARHLGPIKVERIFLYEENPRHEPIESEPEIIAHLCKDEQVLNLARDIAEAGSNPLELLGLVQIPGSRPSTRNYQVWEGNRRVCAIKLLNDPDLAPAHLRKDFARLASISTHVPIDEINAVVFDDHEDLRYWMGIIHGGAQSGVGRLDWDAQQKERHFGSGRNRVALAVLDAAQTLSLITKEEREGKLTTVQRFLNSEIVRQAIGIDTDDKDDIKYNRPFADFKEQLSRFIDDLKQGTKITSRHNRAQIDSYGRALARNSKISGRRIAPISLMTIKPTDEQKKKKGKEKRKSTKPAQPKKPDQLIYDNDLEAAIQEVGSDKLASLYYSLCSVDLDHHTPLLTIGLWAFIETIAAKAGKGSEVSFEAFYSKQRLSDYGLGDGKKTGPIRNALTRIQDNGNATKHHEISASFDGKQLYNDMATVTPLLLETLKGLPPKK